MTENEKLIAEAEAHDKAATPGPWRVTRHDPKATGPDHVALVDKLEVVPRANGMLSSPEADAAFLAWARTAVPKLAAALRESEERAALNLRIAEAQTGKKQEILTENGALCAKLDALDSYAGVLGLLRAILDDRYPADVFQGGGGDGDCGVSLVTETRRLLDDLRSFATLRSDLAAASKALVRMEGACSRYLEEQVPSEAQIYDSEYVSPLTQARAALARPGVREVMGTGGQR